MKTVEELLTGIIPPLCTPLDENLDVDTESLSKLVEFQLSAGVNALFLLGSSGEATFLTDDQRDTVIDTAVRTVAGQVPVLAGVLDSATARVVEKARRAAALGADAIVAVGPTVATHPNEVARHFRLIAAAVDIPQVIYNIGQTRVDIPVVDELVADGSITAIKDSTGDFTALRSLIAIARENPGFTVATGSELLVDAAFLMGSNGAVPGLANVDPHSYVRLADLCKRGQWDDARALQDGLVRLFDVQLTADPKTKGTSSSFRGGIKTALMIRGIIRTNATSQPHQRLSPDEVDAVAAVLSELGLR